MSSPALGVAQCLTISLPPNILPLTFLDNSPPIHPLKNLTPFVIEPTADPAYAFSVASHSPESPNGAFRVVSIAYNVLTPSPVRSPIEHPCDKEDKLPPEAFIEALFSERPPSTCSLADSPLGACSLHSTLEDDDRGYLTENETSPSSMDLSLSPSFSLTPVDSPIVDQTQTGRSSTQPSYRLI